MKHYEIMVLLSGAIEPAAVTTIKTRVEQYLQQAGATITTNLELERRRLAYKVRQQSYGYYCLWQFDAEPAAINAIDQKMRLDNEVIRYLLVEAMPRSADQIKELIAGEKYKIVKPTAASVAEAETKTSVTALTEEEKMFASAPVAKQPQPDSSETAKVSMEELDKKLDAILEDSDLAAKL